MKDQYKCQSYYDDDNILRDCTCGKCKLTEELAKLEKGASHPTTEDQIEQNKIKKALPKKRHCELCELSQPECDCRGFNSAIREMEAMKLLEEKDYIVSITKDTGYDMRTRLAFFRSTDVETVVRRVALETNERITEITLIK